MDVTIRVGHHRIPAERNILSAVSPFFETLFSVNTSEEIELRDVNGEAVEMIVQHAHTGSLDISRNNVNDLIRAANVLRIDSVTDACCRYLENNLAIENCLDVQGLASSLGLLRLRDSVESFIVQHLRDLTIGDQVMRMPVDLMLQLLERDDVTVMGDGFYADPSTEEEKILEVVLRYVESDPEERRLKHLSSLLSRGLRLMLLSPSRLEALKSSPLISSSPESLKLVSGALSSETSDVESKRWRRPRNRLVLYHQKTVELAGPELLQSETPAEVFDDGKTVKEGQCIYVIGLKICTRLWGDGRPIVGGLRVFYNTGRSILHGSDGYGCDDHEFQLDPDERIIAINASTGWLIDRIMFASNLGRTFGPYGGYGGTQHYLERPCKGGYLAYVTGSVEMIHGESAVRHIRFVWGYYAR